MFPFRYLVKCLVHKFSGTAKPEDDNFYSGFYNQVLKIDTTPPGSIEEARANLYNNKNLIIANHIGAGSRMKRKNQTVGEMAGTVSISAHHGALLFRMAQHYKPRKIIEMGTAMGISALYLAAGNPEADITTVEGNPQLASLAMENFKNYGSDRIHLLNKSFEEVIDQLAAEAGTGTLVYIDGNHTCEATLSYYQAFTANKSTDLILIFDDINWSAGMMDAWDHIRKNLSQGVIIDLFHMGIVFYGNGVEKKEYKVRY
ncbi:MAG: class I SAM-dependent methyltransferase [Bacteroidales bacterium]